MAMNGTGTQFDKTELQRLMREQGVDPDPKDEEKPAKSRISWARVILFLATVAYFALLFFGKNFLSEDVLNSMNVFSDAENPNRVIRAASLAVSVSFIFITRQSLCVPRAKKPYFSRGATHTLGI